jgi:hypothetical protein
MTANRGASLALLGVLSVLLGGCTSTTKTAATTVPAIKTASTLPQAPLAPPGGGVFGELVAFHPIGGHGSALTLLPANTVKNYPLEFAKGWDVTVLGTATTWDPARCGVMPSVSTPTSLVWFEKPLYNADQRAYRMNIFDGVTMRSITPTANATQTVESLSLQAASTGEVISYVYRQLPPPDLTGPVGEAPTILSGGGLVDAVKKIDEAATAPAAVLTSTTTSLQRPFGRLILRTLTLSDRTFRDVPINVPTGHGVLLARSIGGGEWILDTVVGGKGGRLQVIFSKGKVTVKDIGMAAAITPKPRTIKKSVWVPSLAPANAEVSIDGKPPLDIPIPETVQRCVLAIRS